MSSEDEGRGEKPTVLIVEDEPDLTDLYATWLAEDYIVRASYGGEEALETLGESVDVILLDRRMPDLSGDEVLTEIREREIECRVAMVTAVEPDFDIVAMGFDDYLVKPVSKDALLETVENLLRRDSYGEGVTKLFSLASKKALLEAEKGAPQLEDSEEYRALTEELEELREDLDRTLGEISEQDDLTSLYRELGRDVDPDVPEED